MKKIALLALSLLLIITIFGCHKTDTEKLEETPVSDFEYEILDEKVNIIKYIGTSKYVVIPKTIDNLPVTSLNGREGDDIYSNEGVFENSAIETVVIPESVLVIGSDAFKDCKNLNTVTIKTNSNLKHIGSMAFENCVKIEKLDFSSTKIKSILVSSFQGCTGLKDIKLPDSASEIGEKAFNGCSSLLEIHLPKELIKVDVDAFANCTALKRITIPANLELFSPGFSRFNNMPSLEQIIFEDGREEIEGYAFFGINSSVEITVPKSVKRFSPLPFIVDGKDVTPITVRFLGDCPEVVDIDGFSGELTICYDPNTEGWDNCEWKNQYNIELIQ